MAITPPVPSWVPTTSALTQADINAGALTVVHYWAVWNIYDREMNKHIAAIRADYVDRIVFRSCNADQPENLPYFKDVSNVPAIGGYFGGRRIKVLIGLRSEKDLRKLLDEWLAATSS